MELALELIDALAHAGNSDAEKRISTIGARRQGHANAVVADGKADLFRRADSGNFYRTRLGVAVDVRE
jgi:hypothetical protein